MGYGDGNCFEILKTMIPWWPGRVPMVPFRNHAEAFYHSSTALGIVPDASH